MTYSRPPNETRARDLTHGLIPCAGSRDVYHRPERVGSCAACAKAGVDPYGAGPDCRSGVGNGPEGSTPSASTIRLSRARAGEATCVLGHHHDSKGERNACPRVYAEAEAAGRIVFRPGRPGIPIFALDPGENGRPVYVSADWVLVDRATRKVVAVLDYKGRVAKSKRWDRSWSRGRRALETELGIRVEELA